MEFSDQIKNLRKQTGLTQDQFAEKLHVTRQAISNWENNRNLPDLEMLIQISRTFDISLDKLILGDTHMNKMTEKLIKDTDENRTAKFNMVSAIVGGCLMLMGFLCFIIKGMSVEYIDKHGILHENFFLLPMGYMFLFAGLIVIIVTAVAYLRKKHRA
ncbi:MAG: DUF3955 domain-containing protein [Lactobacillus sp.]|jgi:transcriptional regulator with XRE-family HTH domain|nr:DUF3955 domain-containing protein [Lactobacillus sp.]MCH4068165.1 DUF3955 domain-containing protein [Lactobacillus sp.]MCI1304346.1 DUF3955 domain-containing protein [Lactobacillus sp.]MCI1330096.1 DUF3955 domain-containing protein [Lactobacillus sp.]MCI1360019.1 DUF3955 domain-containing protein [Lactobacillus sp.]